MNDKECIEALQKSAMLNDVIRQLDSTSLTANNNVLTLPDGFSLVDMTKYQDKPRNFNNTFKTRLIEEFQRYVLAHKQKDTVLYVSTSGFTATSIIDAGTPAKPSHRRHHVKITLDKTGPYLALCNFADGRKTRQKVAAEFLEDWAPYVVSIKTSLEDELNVPVACNEIRNLTVEKARTINSKVDDFGYEASAMERAEAKRKDVMPAFIEFRCVPYHQLAERTFKIRVGIVTDDETPMLTFRIMGNEQIQDDLVEEFKDILTEKLDVTTYIGTGSD